MSANELMQTANMALVVIDLQSKLAPAISGIDSLLRHAQALLKTATHCGLPIAITEHCPKALGSTNQAIFTKAPTAAVFTKSHFDATREPDGLLDHLNSLNRPHLLVIGCEAHVCVLQTSLGLLNAGFNISIAVDATGSRHKLDQEIAHGRLREAGANLVTSEMAIFEWLERGDTQAFKSILPTVRELKLS